MIKNSESAHYNFYVREMLDKPAIQSHSQVQAYKMDTKDHSSSYE